MTTKTIVTAVLAGARGGTNDGEPEPDEKDPAQERR